MLLAADGERGLLKANTTAVLMCSMRLCVEKRCGARPCRSGAVRGGLPTATRYRRVVHTSRTRSPYRYLYPVLGSLYRYGAASATTARRKSTALTLNHDLNPQDCNLDSERKADLATRAHDCEGRRPMVVICSAKAFNCPSISAVRVLRMSLPTRLGADHTTWAASWPCAVAATIIPAIPGGATT